MSRIFLAIMIVFIGGLSLFYVATVIQRLGDKFAEMRINQVQHLNSAEEMRK
jgi:hypothetical protein